MARALVLLLAGLSLGACSRGRDPGTVACTAGRTIEIGCASACGLGSCGGDAVLRACDGEDWRACADGIGILAESDDACGSLCPLVRATCPASGHVAVTTRGFGGGEASCSWEMREVGAAPLVSDDDDDAPDAGP